MYPVQRPGLSRRPPLETRPKKTRVPSLLDYHNLTEAEKVDAYRLRSLRRKTRETEIRLEETKLRLAEKEAHLAQLELERTDRLIEASNLARRLTEEYGTTREQGMRRRMEATLNQYPTSIEAAQWLEDHPPRRTP